MYLCLDFKMKCMTDEQLIVHKDKLDFTYDYLKRKRIPILEHLNKSELKVLSYCLSIQVDKEFKFNKSDSDKIENIFQIKYFNTKRVIESLIKDEIIFKKSKGCYLIHSSLQYIENITIYKFNLQYEKQ